MGGLYTLKGRALIIISYANESMSHFAHASAIRTDVCVRRRLGRRKKDGAVRCTGLGMCSVMQKWGSPLGARFVRCAALPTAKEFEWDDITVHIFVASARVTDCLSVALRGFRKAVVSPNRRKLRVGRLHTFKIGARIIMSRASDGLYCANRRV